MLNEHQIMAKWTEIKGGIQNLWGKITDDEIDQFQGDVTGVSGIVQQRYGESQESIREKLDRLMATFDNETDKSTGGPNVTSYHRAPTEETSLYHADAEDLRRRERERLADERNLTFDAGLEDIGTGPQILAGEDPALSNVPNATDSDSDFEWSADETEDDDQLGLSKAKGRRGLGPAADSDRVARQ